MVRKILSIFLGGLLITFGTSGLGEPVEWPTDEGGNGHFYEARLVEGGINWNDALLACVNDDGYLATINSPEENAFVFGLVSGNPDFWYLDPYNNGIGPWIGGYQPTGSPEPGGNWRWAITNEPFDTYTNWHPSQPDNAFGLEHCMNFIQMGGLIGDWWNDMNGEAQVLGYIVEFSPPVPVSNTSQVTCTLFPNFPNPFNPQTTIAFEIPKTQTVTLRIFDMSGRLVRELITAEPHTPGRHEVVWNGRDDMGQQAASGAYFYRLEAGSYSETKRMVLIK